MTDTLVPRSGDDDNYYYYYCSIEMLQSFCFVLYNTRIKVFFFK